ncbi:Lrp/AsnC family transcriptional regulator [Pseudorhizobium endolithicum]|uniref:Lrp/AsnC family transcriptional regulator n=1 Tax=Pseudorhizobium endolithicum TaxID=1191678 RepID=A0ABM8PL90_9HYPH|nr:Lrp/AsnC family transcriptional regulator [Pseudorhizobium endolithicum]CAD7036150.1 Lrp/AsnC family transcriptional regulator [Pseudorhizobium endolithicum]
MLDEKDGILIAALRRNARESLVGLARKVGLSRSATQERMRRLERDGIIKGYTVDLASKGDPAVRAIIAVVFQPGYRCKQIVPTLTALPEVVACYSLAGSIDLMVNVSCESNAALSRIRDVVASVQGVATATTHIVLATEWSRI